MTYSEMVFSGALIGGAVMWVLASQMGISGKEFSAKILSGLLMAPFGIGVWVGGSAQFSSDNAFWKFLLIVCVVGLAVCIWNVADLFTPEE